MSSRFVKDTMGQCWSVAHAFEHFLYDWLLLETIDPASNTGVMCMKAGWLHSGNTMSYIQ